MQSPLGHVAIHEPATVQAENLRTHFDLIVLCCKAYDRDDVILERTREILTTEGSTLTASVLRDIENGSRIETDHIVGDMLQRRTEAGLESSGASLAFHRLCHLKAYEARRAGTASKAP
ncbi:hypothetical protein [Thiomonas sp. X19]|uniref:hypothetical protein n=1 Tax=Thiomonas sp. X19 TaxID=1050370 RepID=UPI00352B8790